MLGTFGIEEVEGVACAVGILSPPELEPATLRIREGAASKFAELMPHGLPLADVVLCASAYKVKGVVFAERGEDLVGICRLAEDRFPGELGNDTLQGPPGFVSAAQMREGRMKGATTADVAAPFRKERRVAAMGFVSSLEVARVK